MKKQKSRSSPFFINWEMSLCLYKGTEILQLVPFSLTAKGLSFYVKKHKSHRTYFSLTARFLSGYVKKTNLAVNHFSSTANIFMISLSLEKNHKANPGLGKCRSLYVSIEEKNPYRMIASLNEPIEALKKGKKEKH